MTPEDIPAFDHHCVVLLIERFLPHTSLQVSFVSAPYRTENMHAPILTRAHAHTFCISLHVVVLNSKDSFHSGLSVMNRGKVFL